MRVIQWVLGNRFLVLLVTAALAIGGIVAWKHLPIDAFPDVTNTQVMVLSEGTQASPRWTWSPGSAFPIEQPTCAACHA